MRNRRAFRIGRVSLSRIYLFSPTRFHLVEQVIGFYALAFSPAHFDVWPLRGFLRNFVAHFDRAARRQRDDVVGEMLQMIGFVVVTKGTQRRDDHLLWVSLARIDHVKEFLRVP